MNTRTVRLPSAEHPIAIESNPNRVIVTVGGKTVADTHRALTVREASYPPVHYVPREDVDMTLLHRSAHATYCPYKGECAYFDIPHGREKSVNAVWTYEEPYDAVASIKGHLAFYPDRVDVIHEK